MNCGIYCVREYMKILGIDGNGIISELEKSVSESGISVFQIVNCFRNNGLKMKAFRDRKLPERYPFIVYLPFFHHFLLVKGRNHFTYLISDIILGTVSVPRPFFRFLFSNIYLMMI